MIEPFTFAPGKIVVFPFATFSLPSLLWALFWICVVYSIIHAAIILYHWHAYNIAGSSLKTRTIIIYTTGTFFFLLLIAFSLSLITP